MTLRFLRKRGVEGAVVLLIFSVVSAVLAEQYTYKYEGKRDPFIPLISPAGFLINLEPENNATLRLEGVMYDPEGNSMAIINGELVRVGENVGDAVVSSIEPNKVTVTKDNQKEELEIRKGE